MEKSIFTKIIEREIPASIVYENERIIVIRDIAPKAKTHLLIIPKKEIPTVNDLQEEDNSLIAEMFHVAKHVAKQLSIHEWYQLHINVGKKGWQEVMHLHMHLLSHLEEQALA